MSKPIRVALVGYGLAGKVFHAPLIRATAGMELAAIVSSRIAEIADDFPGVPVCSSIEQVIDQPDIDLVVIATPDELHATQALAALAAGKHVVTDKPFATILADAQAAAAMAERTGQLLSVFHNRRWDADFLTLQSLISAGELGEVRQFESHFDRYRPIAGERWKDRRSGGVWQDLGAHLVDQAIQLFGMPKAVFADLAAQKGGSADYAHVLLDQGPVRTILHITQVAAAHSLRFAVHGTKASYIKHGLDPQENQSKAGMLPGAAGWAIDLREGELTRGFQEGNLQAEMVPNLPGDYLAYYCAIEAALTLGCPNPVPADQAIDIMAVIDAAIQSARTKAWITL